MQGRDDAGEVQGSIEVTPSKARSKSIQRHRNEQNDEQRKMQKEDCQRGFEPLQRDLQAAVG